MVLCNEGSRVLLHMIAGSKEDAETVTAFFEVLKRWSLTILCLSSRMGRRVSSRPSSLLFARRHRRCLAHRMRIKVAEDLWPAFKARV
jgi:putative transposase